MITSNLSWFYRTTPFYFPWSCVCLAGCLNARRPSVHPSVTHLCPIKTAKRKITPHIRPKILLKFKRVTQLRREMQAGCVTSAVFLTSSSSISYKLCKLRTRVTREGKDNGNSYTLCQIVLFLLKASKLPPPPHHLRYILYVAILIFVKFKFDKQNDHSTS